jgi:hypothetical protein
MRTFYDFRTTDFNDPKKYPLQGYVLIKTKMFWLCWIYKDESYLDSKQTIRGFIVAPKTIYLYNVYIAKSFWDAIKYLLKNKNNYN